LLTDLADISVAREHYRADSARFPALDEAFDCLLGELRSSMGLIFKDCWGAHVSVTDVGVPTLADGGRR
jgi:hypothetical protein